MRKLLLIAAAAVLTASAPAAAAPLSGEGEGMELVANLPIGTGTDLELHGDHAFIGSYEQGLVIIDVSDPYRPRPVGRFDCPGQFQEFAISPDGRWGAFGLDSPENGCHPGEQGVAILDLRDRTAPREVDWIPLARGAHTTTIDWPYLYANQYDPAYHRLEIHSIKGGRVAKVGEIDYGEGGIGPHDSYVKRVGGRRLLYAASIDRTDVIDVTDPARPKLLQRLADPAINNAHQAEPNHDGSLLLVSDEYTYGLQGAPACGKLADSFVAIGARLPFTSLGEEPGTPPLSPADPANTSALHFYALDRDGTVPGNLDGKIGSFNIPLTTETGGSGCGIHVYSQAPAENRLVTAWLGQGVKVLDYADPKAVRELGWFRATDADVWAIKPHRGFLFAGDRRRGFDVYRFKGAGWPASAGPAEARFAKPARRATGSRRVRIPVEVPRRRGRLVTLSVRDARGTLVQRLRFRVRPARRNVLDFTAAGLAGRYRYRAVLARSGRTLRVGSFRVRPGAAIRVRAGRPLICRT